MGSKGGCAMKPVNVVVIGGLLVAGGTWRLLEQHNVSTMDRALNILCFVCLCIGLLVFIKGMFEELKP